MKKIIILIFVAVNFLIYSQEEKISNEWVKAQILVRGSYEQTNKNELRLRDIAFLDKIEKADIKEAEPNIAEYLKKIIFEDKKFYDIPNIERSLDILQNKFNDKNYFLDYSSKLGYSNNSRNPFVLKKILEGYTKLMDGNDEKVFQNFELFQRNLDVYVKNFKAYGSDYVIPVYIAFLREYIRLVSNNKIKDTQRKKIINICEDMRLNKKSNSDFEQYAGGEELKQEFFFYNETSFKKN
jgi:hypothetical protein